jgi:hypothetical protein
MADWDILGALQILAVLTVGAIQRPTWRVLSVLLSEMSMLSSLTPTLLLKFKTKLTSLSSHSVLSQVSLEACLRQPSPISHHYWDLL